LENGLFTEKRIANAEIDRQNLGPNADPSASNPFDALVLLGRE
jgi:hypothetical protein